MRDAEGPVILVFLALAVLLVALGASFASASYEKDGTKGRDCFANNTCRIGLVCLHGDGHEPGTCIAPDGGAR